MLEALQLTATYLPERHEVDIELVLQDDGGSWPDVSQVWSVHPTFHNTNLPPLIDGPIIQLTESHGKVRRAGYVKIE